MHDCRILVQRATVDAAAETGSIFAVNLECLIIPSGDVEAGGPADAVAELLKGAEISLLEPTPRAELDSEGLRL